MQFYQLSQTSLAKSGSSVVEEYIPLWMADGTYTNANTTSGVFVADGYSGTYGTAQSLHTLGNWNTNQQFSLEVTTYINATGTGYVELYDVTTSSVVTGGSISTTSTTASVIRSGKFTLIAGHSYGIRLRTGASYLVYLIDASLVVFGQ